MRIGRSVACAIALVSIASAAVLAAQQLPETQAAPQSPESATRTRPTPPIAVSQDGKLSVAVSRANLASVLKEIAIHADLQIVLADTLTNDAISFKGRDLPLEEGLKRLLAAYDVFYLYSAADSKTPGSLKTVWVYSRGEASDLQPVPSAMWASTKELERQLEDPDPDVRSDTYESLIERQGERALPTLRRGLADTDESVRLRALSSAIDADVDIPVADLEQLILDTQSSQSMRVLALQSIEAKPEAEAIAVALSNDPDDMVRNQAHQILERRRRPPI